MFVVNSKYQKQDENKCNRLFRPWTGNSVNPQDATVSTTTECEESLPDPAEKIPDTAENKKGFRPIPKSETVSPPEEPQKHYNSTPNMPLQVPETYRIYPEIFPANIAQTLGLTATDPLFLESMAQGYALEEYARVLNQEQQAKILQARKQRPKKYKCPHCNVGFSNNGQLKGHIRIHTGERPFKCEEKDCGKTFTRNEELTRHKRIHSGLRPFPCTHCGKRFGRKDHLKKHSRTHFQPRGLVAYPVMVPFDTWTSPTAFPFMPMYGY